ncbi:MAG TPA: leucine-rich repeat domain-containing protein [Paludibacter sp.]|nr:leucine-rich repeat domain-containing protein [Paludibacter sp.]
MAKKDTSDWKFIVVNTLFWLLLGGLLFSNKSRFTIGGAILFLIIGSLTIYLGLKKSGGLRYPGLVRIMAVVSGIIYILTSGWLFIDYFTSDEHISMKGRIAQVANKETTTLDLSGRKLTALDPKIMELSTLTFLNLENNRLTELPPEIGRLVNLTFLNLEDNQLTELPPEIGRLVNLTFLNLDNNQLTELPPEIGNLTNLKILWLRNNHITNLPPEIGNLHKLESLALSDNQLSTLPSEIGQLSSLQHLALYRNQLTVLPREIGQLSNLTTLFLDDNQLTKLPPELERLTQLQTLSLNRNPLGELPDRFMEQAQSRGLKISYKPDEKLPPQGDGGLLLFLVVFVAIILITFGLNRWIGKREEQLKLNLNTSGRVYAIPAGGRAGCIFVLLLKIMVDVFLFIASLHPEETGVAPAAGIGIPLLFSPLIIICLYILVHYDGFIVLTGDAIILRRLWGEKRLPYHEITDVKESSLWLPFNMIIKGTHTKLSIPRSIEKFPELYGALMQQITRKPSVPDITRKFDAPSFPYHLALTRKARIFSIGGSCLLVVLYLGIGLAGFWVPYIQAKPPAYDFAFFLFGAISLFFLPAIFIFVKGMIAAKQPIEMILTAQSIGFRFPGKSWQTWPIEQISAIRLEPVKINISVKNSPVFLWSEATAYRIILKSNTQQLMIEQDRIRQFGFQPEQLYRVFQQLYHG